MAQIQFGWMVPITNPEAKMDSRAFMDAIRHGFDTIAGHFHGAWVPDHLQFGDRPILEGWTELTYLAAQHPELKYGHIVLCQLFRNPALLAKMAATLQYMSHGNFILGMGAGWQEEECKAYNFPFPPSGQRVEALDESLQIIKALWHEDNVTFEGKYHRITNAYCQPKPDPLPPIMVAAFQPRMMRLTARHADWWNITIRGDIAQTKEMIDKLNAACEAVGRDPKMLRRTAMISCYCAPTEQEVKALTDKHTGPFGLGLVGTPNQIVEQIQPYINLGFDYFMFFAGGFPAVTTLEMLSHEVLPSLKLP